MRTKYYFFGEIFFNFAYLSVVTRLQFGLNERGKKLHCPNCNQTADIENPKKKKYLG